MSTAVKVGIFLVGGVALFCVGLFLIGSRAQLFSHHYEIYTQFNDINTLESGAKVRVGGMDAGQVSAIEVPKTPSSKFRLKLKVDEKFKPIIREDSVASLETEGMVGNIFVNIKKGSDHSPECPAGCTLPSQEAVSMDALMQKGKDLANTMQSMMTDLQHRADGAIQNITSAAGHADTLISQATPNVVQLTGNANALVAGIRQGKGAAGKLLTDKKTADNVDATIADARKTAGNFSETAKKVDTMVSQIQQTDLPSVKQTLTNVQDMTHQMDQATGTFLAKGKSNEGTAVALRDAAHGAQQATTNLADDTEALKHNFFFRGFFKRRGYFDMQTITPSKYESSRFVKKPRARVWVAATGVFQTGPDGSQQLTQMGRGILDQSMSGLVPYLPNNPIVIEGYSMSGKPDQQYLASRQRALAVRDYLDGRFHLNPERVGAIPLGSHPPAHTDRKSWDGVCLVLVVSKQ